VQLAVLRIRLGLEALERGRRMTVMQGSHGSAIRHSVGYAPSIFTGRCRPCRGI
jgi:hypothetical protein